METIFNLRRSGTLNILWIVLFAIPVISARAAVQVFAFSEAPSISNLSQHDFHLPEFNPALGALDSVSIELRGTGEFFQWFGHASGQGTHRALTGEPMLSMTLGLPGDEELLSVMQRAGERWPTRTGGVRIQPVTFSGHATLTSEADLMQFTGSGMVDLLISARTGSGRLLSGGMNLASGLWAAGANISVVYNYTAVPESSATWVAGGMALALVLASVRKGAWSKS